jgi:uncharacterized protein YbaR (Trm112 family)
MECPECKAQLQFEREKFESDEGSTDVYVVLNGYCLNPNCGSWCGVRTGGNLSNATKIAKTVRNKVN